MCTSQCGCLQSFLQSGLQTLEEQTPHEILRRQRKRGVCFRTPEEKCLHDHQKNAKRPSKYRTIAFLSYYKFAGIIYKYIRK